MGCWSFQFSFARTQTLAKQQTKTKTKNSHQPLGMRSAGWPNLSYSQPSVGPMRALRNGGLTSPLFLCPRWGLLLVPFVPCGNTVTLSLLPHSSWPRTKRSHMWLPTSTNGWRASVCACAVPGACRWPPSSPLTPRCWGATCVLVLWTSTTTWRM